jgi:hypothetical protein
VTDNEPTRNLARVDAAAGPLVVSRHNPRYFMVPIRGRRRKTVSATVLYLSMSLDGFIARAHE